MKRILIAMAITLASCTEDNHYTIDAEIDQTTVFEDLHIGVQASASEGVNKVSVIYNYFLAPGESIQSKDYINPLENQTAFFKISRYSQLDYIYVIVTDDDGHYKRFEL